HPAGAGDDAQKRLAERRAPRPHGANVAPAGPRRAVGVSMQEADHVAAPLLAAQHPRTIETDVRALALSRLDAPRVPYPAAPPTDQRPAAFDYGRCGGCTSQYCSSDMPRFSSPTGTISPSLLAWRSTPTRLCRSKCASAPSKQMPATCTDRSSLATM